MAVSSFIDDPLVTISHLQVKEVTLLGQNVNSYKDLSESSLALFPEISFDVDQKQVVKNAPGFKTIYKPKIGGVRFADLLQVSCTKSGV